MLKVMLVLMLLFCGASFPWAPALAQSRNSAEHRASVSSDTTREEPSYVDLAKPGKKVDLGNGYRFTWRFVEKPKMGTVILKIQIFDQTGKRSSALEVAGRSDMPSMRGAHDSGEKSFKVSKKLDYLLPVDVVMPGDWEVLVTFTKDTLVIFRGRISFDV